MCPSTTRWALMAVGGVILAGCAGAGGQSERQVEGDVPEPATLQDAVPLPSHGRADEGEDDSRNGTLVADLDAGCVWLDSVFGREPVLWPPGWRLVPASGDVVNDEGEVVARIGEEARLHGGSSAAYRDLLPDECLTDEAPFLVNPLDGGVLYPGPSRN